MEPVFLKNTTLHERQMRFYNGSHCVYCGNPTELVDSKEVYLESHGLIFLCRRCKAWVGTHYKTSDHSLGFVATKDLRQMRHKCHLIFDPLWQIKVTSGTNKKKAQSSARNWLAEKLGIDKEECHIGMMDIERCKLVIEFCEEVYRDLEVKKVQRENDTKFIVDAVYFLQQDLNEIYNVKEHKWQDQHQLSLIHNVTGLVVNIQPKNKTFTAGQSKWKKFDSVETLIYKYFKK